MCVNHTFILKAKWPRYQQNTNKKNQTKSSNVQSSLLNNIFYNKNTIQAAYKPFEWCLMNRSTKKK